MKSSKRDALLTISSTFLLKCNLEFQGQHVVHCEIIHVILIGIRCYIFFCWKLLNHIWIRFFYCTILVLNLYHFESYIYFFIFFYKKGKNWIRIVMSEYLNFVANWLFLFHLDYINHCTVAFFLGHIFYHLMAVANWLLNYSPLIDKIIKPLTITKTI